jgi:hypothetical protein
MSDEPLPKPPLREEERQLVELLKAIFTAFRERNHPPSPTPEKPRWQRFLESAGGTAVISVFIAGIATQIITCTVQTSLKERDTEQAYIKARGEQALVSYKDYLDQERQAVQQAYAQIGSCLSAGHRVIEQTGPQWQPKPGFTFKPQQDEIKRNFNEVNTQWRSGAIGLGAMMSYYHPDGPDVLPSWRCVQTAMTEYMDCAEGWGIKYSEPNPGATTEQVKIACVPHLTRVNESLDRLSTALETSRHYPWEGWDSLAELKKALNSNSNSNQTAQPAPKSSPSPCPTLKTN